MPPGESDSVLTTNEAIEYLKISKPTFLMYVHEGRIKAIKVGKAWKILESELYRFPKGEETGVEKRTVKYGPFQIIAIQRRE